MLRFLLLLLTLTLFLNLALLALAALALAVHAAALVALRNLDVVAAELRALETAVAELAPPLWGFKRGRMTFKRAPVEVLKP